jgi:tetratricopeptide (TPR) repeat protein
METLLYPRAMEHPARPLSIRLKFVASLAAAALVAGCVQDDARLRQGYDALQNRQFDRALQLADQQIQSKPNGPGSAEAYYLRGRALEERSAGSAGESASNLAAARAAYEQALSRSPAPQLETYIKASLGNVAFFQDDYAKAADMFKQSSPGLSDVSRAWTLYRAGLSYQRLGQFEEADKYFDDTIRRYPGTLQAQRAAEVRGQRAFYVRLGTYGTMSAGDAAANELRRQGFRGISTFRDTKGLYVVRLGPYPSYIAARDARLQVVGRFKDALIMP